MSIKTQETLILQADTDISDNDQRLIEEKHVRNLFKDIIDTLFSLYQYIVDFFATKEYVDNAININYLKGFGLVEGFINGSIATPEPEIGKLFLCTKSSNAIYITEHLAVSNFTNQVSGLDNLNWAGKTSGVKAYLKQISADINLMSYRISTYQDFILYDNASQAGQYQNKVMPIVGQTLNSFSGSWTRINAVPVADGSIVSIKYFPANYIEGKLYIGNGTSFEEYIPKDGLPVTFAFDMTLFVANKTYYADRVWIYDSVTATFYDGKEIKVAKDVEITDSSKGLILKSPNGSRWRMTIADDGTFIKTLL